MNGDRLTVPEEQWADWLAAGDNALAAGSRVEALSIPGAPPELQLDLAYAARVRQALRPPARPAVAATSDAGGQPDTPTDLTQELYDFLAPPEGPDAIGQLGTYRVLGVLGAGGMGVVFLAVDPQLQRRVALKAMKPALAVSTAARQRFLREARAMAAVKDERIVTIHQVGEDRGLPFLAMELLEGETLDRRLKREGRLPMADGVHIGREAALGLAAAHAQGLIHRDIKPANLWLQYRQPTSEPLVATDCRVKLLDFGLARAADTASSLTQIGAVLGTPAYMAPEQAQGHEIDPRSDLFSLGCVLYRLCTGKVPFDGRDTLTILAAMALRQPTPPREINPEVSPALSDLILQLLARDPADRPSSARAVAEALEKVQIGEDKSAVLPAANRPTTRRWLPAELAVAMLLGAILLAGVAFTLKTSHGTLVVNVSEPDVQVLVDGQEKMTIDSKKVGRVELIPGEHELTVKRGEEELLTTSFTLRSGGELVLAARWEPKPAPRPANPPAPAPDKAGLPPLDEAWFKVVGSLRAELQVEVVKDELKKRNPGFDGTVQVTIRDGAVTQLWVCTDHVMDITPVRVLTALKLLICYGKTKGQLADLSPLTGMTLETLQFPSNQVKDLAPLQGLPALRILHLTSNPISDLSPLTGLPLEELECNGTKVSDLSPLKGMKLRHLHCGGLPVRDLSPLSGMPLEYLACYRSWPGPSYLARDLSPLKDAPLKEVECDFIPERDAELLRSIKSLQTVNSVPVAEVWKKLDAERAAFDEWSANVAKMPPDRQVEAVLDRLKERNPGFDRMLKPTIEGDAVTGLELATDEMRDVSPVRALIKLRKLTCAGTADGQGKLANLWPLKGLTLTHLDVSNNSDLTDLSPLAGMKLTHANFGSVRLEDLTSLKGMPLVEIHCLYRPERDAAILRSITTLEKINGRTPREVLGPVDKPPANNR